MYGERDEYNYPLQTGYLYKTDDPHLVQEFEETFEFNEHVRTRGFLFWQTGLAYGFLPYAIDKYNGGETFLDHIELFFTVGPIVLVESFINGMYSNFLIFFIAQIIWVSFKKEHIWWYRE